MKQYYVDLVKRIQQFSLTCDVKDENGIVHHFHHGHEYVEIGGIKWATMNVGASAPYQSGFYFTWGDINGYSAEQISNKENKYSLSNYKHCFAENSKFIFSKYNSIDGKDILDDEDDGVRACWGGKWRMPTANEFIALGDAVRCEWLNRYQSSGYAFIDKKDDTKMVFFPANGVTVESRISSAEHGGFYWANSKPIQWSEARNFYFNKNCIYWNDIISRGYGLALRGVVGE